MNTGWCKGNAVEHVVEIRNLEKTFAGQLAINGVSFHVKRGEIFGLLGANGAGKTTAISILLGLITPDAGSSVKVFGHDLEENRIPILQRCNFMSAYANLPANLSVIENLKVFGRLYRVNDLDQRIAELAELLEIGSFLKRITGELSSGQATRVGLAKALLNDPDLLLLDEPTASLDPDIADRVRKILKRIQQERRLSIIYTSHNMRDVEELCDRIIFMREGKILSEGSPQQVIDEFGEESLEEVFIRVSRDGAPA
ncbi:MAG: ABC transporter ATP-binding protein [Verrucomicrobiota bacterium]